MQQVETQKNTLIAQTQRKLVNHNTTLSNSIKTSEKPIWCRLKWLIFHRFSFVFFCAWSFRNRSRCSWNWNLIWLSFNGLNHWSFCFPFFLLRSDIWGCGSIFNFSPPDLFCFFLGLTLESETCDRRCWLALGVSNGIVAIGRFHCCTATGSRRSLQVGEMLFR